MSSFDRPAAAVLVALALLAGCSLTPVYQAPSGADPAVVDRIGYADPDTHAEQLIVQALKFALGEGKGAPLVLELAVTSDVSRATEVASVDPATPYTLEMTARYTLIDQATPDAPVLSETRSATATFTRGPQESANRAAEADAEERAARRLADIIRARLLIWLQSGA